jgi:hypothetical protein
MATILSRQSSHDYYRVLWQHLEFPEERATSGESERELITFVFALSFLHEMWDATAKSFP